MASNLELYKVEEIIKQEFLELVRNLSHVELKKFNKNEYKKKAQKELCKLLPKYEKSKLSETAQCISNALQSEAENKCVKDCVNAHPQERMCCRTQSYKILI